MRTNPKKTIFSLFNRILEIIKNNPVFFVYLITSTFIGACLRYNTIHTIDNIMLVKPNDSHDSSNSLGIII